MTRPTRVRHKKRGSEYLVLGEAELQISNPDLTVGPHKFRRLVEGDHLVVYRGEAGKLWLRRPEEFDDGRFEPAQAQESDLRDQLARILEIVARDGLGQPRDLDAALDAIGAAIAVRADEVRSMWGNVEDQIGRPAVHAALDRVLEGLA